MRERAATLTADIALVPHGSSQSRAILCELSQLQLAQVHDGGLDTHPWLHIYIFPHSSDPQPLMQEDCFLRPRPQDCQAA